ncbi:uncharacterized protein BJ212DRAFT_816782 [Suillus subaureus]|uniref:Uncharacterized protein n=1 Tax=Suillus subaureus TaxID=48587 RepID=A0A9P7EIA3_9AGAM|nr:uncharacterized protein BJ212DRAFT_816782 [Suillus subaureus]KAG1822619.1 hypothetical protein BJ212DRAFT_816782 [Suillus subaureus]
MKQCPCTDMVPVHSGQCPDSQRALRKALQTIPINSPTLVDNGGKLKYLDWVVCDTLRPHAPVTWTMRVATKDDQISVTKPFLDRSGESRDVIKIGERHHHTHSGYQQEGHMGGTRLLLQA